MPIKYQLKVGEKRLRVHEGEGALLVPPTPSLCCSSLDQLPEEIIGEILFPFLEDSDLINLSLTNKKFRDLAFRENGRRLATYLARTSPGGIDPKFFIQNVIFFPSEIGRRGEASRVCTIPGQVFEAFIKTLTAMPGPLKISYDNHSFNEGIVGATERLNQIIAIKREKFFNFSSDGDLKKDKVFIRKIKKFIESNLVSDKKEISIRISDLVLFQFVKLGDSFLKKLKGIHLVHNEDSTKKDKKSWSFVEKMDNITGLDLDTDGNIEYMRGLLGKPSLQSISLTFIKPGSSDEEDEEDEVDDEDKPFLLTPPLIEKMNSNLTELNLTSGDTHKFLPYDLCPVFENITGRLSNLQALTLKNIHYIQVTEHMVSLLSKHPSLRRFELHAIIPKSLDRDKEGWIKPFLKLTHLGINVKTLEELKIQVELDCMKESEDAHHFEGFYKAGKKGFEHSSSWSKGNKVNAALKINDASRMSFVDAVLLSDPVLKSLELITPSITKGIIASITPSLKKLTLSCIIIDLDTIGKHLRGLTELTFSLNLDLLLANLQYQREWPVLN